MPTPPTPDDVLLATAAAYAANYKNQTATALALGVSRETVQRHLRQAGERGLLGTKPVLPGMRISQTTAVLDADGNIEREFVQQRPERGEEFEATAGLALKGKTTWVDVLPDGTRMATREVLMERADKAAQLELMRAVIDGFIDEIPRAEPVPITVDYRRSDLLNQFTITDLHFGMLSWREETGADYDLAIAERLLLDWFAAAIAMSPPAETAILAQLGDLVHYDGFEGKTPTSGHILDTDSRRQKVIRVVIRALRRVVRMLLAKHDRVHIIMADANHDPDSEAWLRELFASHFEDEPRVTVDRSAGTYYVFEHGETSLFFHHGHRRGVKDVDSVFAGMFRQIYGRTTKSYAHLGHLHSDGLKSTNLMKVERHETLAAPDSYSADGGWLAGRSAKVITYHTRFGEVWRSVLSPEMVLGAAANDNQAEGKAAA